MHWVSVWVLAAAASADCVVIGLNYAAKGVRISHSSNVFLAFICFGGTFLSMLLGRLLGNSLNPAWTGLAGGILFVGLGAWMLRGALFPRKEAVRQHYSENPEIVDKDASKVIELRESLLIGLLLSINNVGLGIGGGIAGIPVLATPIACAVCSLVFLRIGVFFGGRIANPKVSKALEIASACLILLLGTRETVPLLLLVLG